MSKIKTPEEKKRLSLERDRRNTYGESPHASRKNIPKSKAIQHQQERKAANQSLSQAAKVTEPDGFCLVEGEILEKTKAKRLSGFRKQPDSPLGEAIARKLRRRQSV